MNIIEFIRNLWKRLFGRTPMAESTIQRKEVQFANEKFLPEIVRLLNEGHTITLPLRGFSMRPFLEDNRDKALFTKPTNPKVGDPVLAEIEPGHFVMHRIIAIDGNAVTLRGDGNLNDEHCLLQNVCGAVIGFLRLDAPLPYPPLSSGFLSPHLDQASLSSCSSGNPSFRTEINKITSHK